jgi:large conductance mechanosensitive channel
MGMVQEFKDFAIKGNVMDLAVGVIIGGAFGKIVDSVVRDLIMPVVGIAFGKLDFSSLFIPLGPIPPGTALTLDALKKADVPVLAYGNFITVAVNFTIHFPDGQTNQPIETRSPCAGCRSPARRDARRRVTFAGNPRQPKEIGPMRLHRCTGRDLHRPKGTILHWGGHMKNCRLQLPATLPCALPLIGWKGRRARYQQYRMRFRGPGWCAPGVGPASR